MAGFEGPWNITETPIIGSKLIWGNPPQITIERAGAQYRVKIPLQSGGWLDFVVTQNDRALSGPIGLGTNDYGVRLVFDSLTDPQNIVHGPLGSVIELWISGNFFQPNDMGTITGTRG
jgi:hypothetical protein